MRDFADPPSLAVIGLDAWAPYLMNRIMGRYNGALRQEMARLGLTTPKMRALAILTVTPRPLVGELAAHAIVEPSTMSRALDGLEADGLVGREPDDADSRATRVTITPAGRAAFDALWPHMAAAHARLFRGIPPEERDAFVATLRRVLANTD